MKHWNIFMMISLACNSVVELDHHVRYCNFCSKRPHCHFPSSSGKALSIHCYCNWLFCLIDCVRFTLMSLLDVTIGTSSNLLPSYLDHNSKNFWSSLFLQLSWIHITLLPDFFQSLALPFFAYVSRLFRWVMFHPFSVMAFLIRGSWY